MIGVGLAIVVLTNIYARTFTLRNSIVPPLNC